MSNLPYVPLTATEQDVLSRMIEAQDLYVEIVGWGYHPHPIITSGDKRVQIRFPMEFSKPEGVSVPVWSFRLRLKDRSGRTLTETVQSTVYNYQPLYITAGIQIDLVWDISLESLDPGLVKRILPGYQGTKIKSIKGA